MTSDSSNDIDTAGVQNSDIQKRLEADVGFLRCVADDLESIIDYEGERENTARSEESEHLAVDNPSTSPDIADVLAEPGCTKVVIAEFSTVIELLDREQVGVEGELQVLLTRSVAEQLSKKFPINSYFQKLDEKEEVQIRQDARSDRNLPGLIISESDIYYPLSFGSIDTYIEISNDEIYKSLNDEFRTEFEHAGAIDLDVPTWADLLDGLAEATSRETAQEFETLVEAATPDDLDSLDEVSLALIAAARTGALQYNISKWGEEMNIGSRATFSRRKTMLLDDGVITTETVPVEVGRPRERLLAEGHPDARHEPSETKPETSKVESTDREASKQSPDPGEPNYDGETLDEVLDEMLRDVLLSDGSD